METASSKILFTADMSKAATLGGLFLPTVNWSADSRFALIDCNGRRSGSVMALDMQKRSDFCLPETDETLGHFFPDEDAAKLIQVPRSWFTFDSWESNTLVWIHFDIGMLEDYKTFSDRYCYDLAQRKVVKYEKENAE